MERHVLRRTVLKEFSDLVAISRIKEPTFTLAHIVCPHPPYMFDRDGSLPSLRAVAARSKDASYVRQLEYVTKLTMRAVDAIIANSQTPPIIIIQSDHGSPAPKFRKLWANVSVGRTAKEIDDSYEDRTAILNAYYFPGANNAGLYDTISPVNSFRVLFNDYFGAHYEMLPDTTRILLPGEWGLTYNRSHLRVSPPPVVLRGKP